MPALLRVEDSLFCGETALPGRSPDEYMMSNPVLLDNTEHKDLKIDTRHCARYGDNVNRTLAFSTEFNELHKEYPILFHKDPGSGAFHAHVVLGFDRDENLFLGADDWLGNYVPAILARGPFVIGFQNRETDGRVHQEPVIHIDMDHPRVGTDDGQAVFLPYGGDTPYLEKIMRTLQVIHQGAMLDKIFFEKLESMNLLEPVSIEVTLSNVEKITFPSYYTINGERLSRLGGESLADLNKLGILSLVFFALSSLTNFQRLIALKNKKAAIAE